MSATSPQPTTALRRALRLPHATALVVGTIIGASIFVQPSEITARVPSVAGVFAAWSLSGLLTLFGALACAELASAFPRTGGVYVFLKETYSPLVGFLWGWAMFWSMHSGIIAAIAVVFARYAAFFVPVGETGVKVIAIAAIAVISAINYCGVRHGGRLQLAFTWGKLSAVVVMVVVGLTLGSALPRHFVNDAVGSTQAAGIGVGDFMLAVAAGLFAFGGWHMVTYTAGETENAQWVIPRAMMIGISIVTICYVALNGVYMYVLSLQQVIASTRIAADAADVLVGARGAGAVSGLVMFSTFGAVSGGILAGPRVYYAMARDGLLFSWAGEVHPRYGTPHRAIVLQAIWSSVLVATGTYRALFTRVIYTEWIFFGLMTAGLFVLRRRPDYAPSYRVWGYPVVPALFIAASAVIVVNQIASDPLESAVGLSIVALGAPVYFLWTRARTL